MTYWTLRLKVTASGLAALASLAAVAAIGERALVADLCANQLIQEYPSPDRPFKIVVFERDCGATTPFATQASIVPLDAPTPDGPGNLCSVDDDHGRAPPGPGGDPVLEVRWNGPRSAVLKYAALARRWSGARRSDVVVAFDTF
ncbi:MAG TPA: hypothetical protein VMI54_08290 [Polyangiaceae bacterium]|nr:hypothetical protein [Polyangiaceae bacterium]